MGADKSVKDLIDAGVTVSWDGIDGTVDGGQLKYVTEFKGFSENGDEQSGNYFPVELDEQYAEKPVTLIWNADEPGKTATDRYWVLRVKAAGDKATFKQGEDTICTITFPDSCLAKYVPVMAPSTVKVADADAVSAAAAAAMATAAAEVAAASSTPARKSTRKVTTAATE